MSKILIDEATVKLTLEALNSVSPRHLTPLISNARTALREALAEQPAQQEPVAWLHPANATCVTTDPSAYVRGVPLYTTPQPAQRTWVGLTDDEKAECASPYDSRLCCVEATEAKLKEKNT